MNDIKMLKLKINRARYNLMFMIILTLVNIYFVISSGNIIMPFSSSISVYSTFFGLTLKNDTSSTAPLVIGIIVACAALGALLLCYFKSKDSPFFMFLSFTLLAADLIVLLVICIVNSAITEWFSILDIILHILLLFYIFVGIKAHSEIEKLKKGDAPKKDDADIAEPNSDSEDDSRNSEDNGEPERDKIYKYDDDGTEPLVTGQSGGLSVFAVIRNNKAELVINGYVCDELEIGKYENFSLRAIVNDIDFLFEYETGVSGEAMFLYADDELLDSFGRR